MAANPRHVRAVAGQPAAQAAARSVKQPPPARKEPPSRWQQWYKRWDTTLGMSCAVLALTIGVMGRETRRLFADEGLGYALGIVGTFLIVTLLLYPLRKRFKLLKILGPVRNWFRTHMILGVLGPITILYHANFAFGSVNSSAALIAMLLVAGSGLVGRFLYAKVHHGLYGRKANLKELLASVKLSTTGSGGAAQFVPHLMQQIAEYDRQVLQPPKTVLDSILLPFKLAFKTRRGYREITGFVAERLEEQAVVSPTVAMHRPRLEAACKAFVKEHLRRVRRVASFAAYDRMFSLWHKIHLPFFYLLLVTVVIHVIAVHAYAI